MLRKVIKIDEEACTGCGLCVSACHEGAIALVDGKARLIRDDYCDGLGSCLPSCPVNAISFEEREAAPFDPVAVQKAQAEKAAQNTMQHTQPQSEGHATHSNPSDIPPPSHSQLSHWPCQIKLAPLSANFLAEADLLVAADCCAFAYGNFHEDFIKDHATLIGCPKLDAIDYSEKLGEIAIRNNLSSITVTRMQVPCCGGIERAAYQAAQACHCAFRSVTIGVEGNIINDTGFCQPT